MSSTSLGASLPSSELQTLTGSKSMMHRQAAAVASTMNRTATTCPACFLLVLRYDMDLRDSRELALQRLSRFCRSGFVSVTDFRHDPLRIFAAHECAAIIDPSMATKMTVSTQDSSRTCLSSTAAAAVRAAWQA